MGMLSNYAILLFSLSIVLYVVGYESPFIEVIGQIGTETPILDTLINSLYTAFTNPIFLIGMAAAGVASVAGNWGYSSTAFLGPLMIFVGASFIANFFVLPTSFIFQATLPTPISLIIFAFLNLFLLLGLLEFIGGPGV